MKNKMVFCVLLLIVAISTSGVFAQTVHRPFNKKNLDGWKPVNDNAESFLWKIGKASTADENAREMILDEKPGEGVALVNMAGPDWGSDEKQRGVDLYTEKQFGDCTLEIEFMVPKGSNSGVYLMGEYEVQVLDSYGKTGELSQSDVGAIYSAASPKVNAANKPGDWQKFVIDFQAPKFDASGNKTKNAFFKKITLNDKVVQENVEVTKGSTGGGVTGKEAAKGPLMLQGNHGPVAYRNIVIREK